MNALERMRRFRGMRLDIWMFFFVTGSLRTLCVAVTLAVIMAVPLLSAVYRKRFDDFFGIAAPDEEMKRGS